MLQRREMQLDPYNNTLPTAQAKPGHDPFEITVNTAIQRVEALRAVVQAREGVKRSMVVLADAEREAMKVGAYTLVPEMQRPAQVPA